ncbi:MAG: hypothetical protein ABL915_04950 [Gallionella sp.]
MKFMQKTFIRRAALVVVVAGFVTGCASMVSSDVIEKNTAFTLGLEKGDFTISNREDSGVKSSYDVKTKAGKKYSCYLTSSMGMTSDALCSEKGKTSKPSSENSPSCNALLKAAGRCN